MRPFINARFTSSCPRFVTLSRRGGRAAANRTHSSGRLMIIGRVCLAVLVGVVGCAPITSRTMPRDPRRTQAEVEAERGRPYATVSGIVRADTVRVRRSAETFSYALYSRVPRVRGSSAAHALVINHRYWENGSSGRRRASAIGACASPPLTSACFDASRAAADTTRASC
jgi:hypothetical protein